MLTCKKESKSVKKLMSDSSENTSFSTTACILGNGPDSHAWAHIHIDHAGLFQGKLFL